MSSSKPYSAILFGSQLIDLKADRLYRIREVLSSTTLLQDLHEAVLDFENFGERLEASNPEVKPIGIRRTSALLSKWMKGNDSTILGALDHHSNAIAGALTVINHILLFVQHFNGSSEVRDRITLLPGSTFEGLCLGKLAATAIRLSSGGEGLGKLSCIAMRLAFCIGAYVDFDQRIAGDTNEVRCFAVTCREDLDELQQIRDILDEFDTAYISVLQKSKVTITVGKTQASALTQKLNEKGSKVRPFNLFGRFHCSKMSWAVEGIMKLANNHSDLQLISQDALESILASILTLPHDWFSTLQQLIVSPEIQSVPFVLSVGEKLISAKLADTLGFQVATADVLSTQRISNEWRVDYQENVRQRSSPFPEDAQSLHYSDSAVAVIGVACKFAGADSLDQLWKLLETGTVMCRNLPEDRFPKYRFERRSYTKSFKGNTLDDINAFDNKFFNISSREAMYMDPQQRLALQVTYQALESAGYFSRDTPAPKHDIGVYLGACTNEYYENVCTHRPSAFSLTGSIRPFIAGKVSHHFGWTGPAIMYDTACAASGTAIHQACRAVASGECSEAIAGGVNIFVSPDTFQNLAAGRFINCTGPSKSFDAAADGYCRGEGVGIVMLKKLSAALRDGDLIKGVIASTAVGQDANETTITVPHRASQMNLYRKALRAACLDAQDVSYVEAHGTGTQVGDPVEAESVRGVFGNPSRQHHEKTYLGSLKSNIGHTEASSGTSGLIKVLLMMEKGIIPQQALFNVLNPAIDPLGPAGIEIPTQNVPWTKEFKAACVNNYGASGTTAVMVITQPPNVRPSLEKNTLRPPQSATYPVSISAFSTSSLAAYCSTLLEFINQLPTNKDLTADITYHLSRRRNLSLPYSICKTVSSLRELKDLCVSTIADPPPKKEKIQRPVVLLFGGQTGKTASISRDLYESSTILRKHLHHCDTTLQILGAPSIFPAIFDQGPHDDVISLHAVLFSVQYASAMTWLDCGLQPARLIGHSFGQLTALCVSGVLSLLDGLRLITTRARCIREYWGKDPGSMIAIGVDLTKVTALLAQHADLGLEIACYNGPQSFVLAGSTSSVDALETVLKSSPEQLRWKRLEVTNAFHSALSEPLIEPLRNAAERLDFRNPRFPLETCSNNHSWQTITPALVGSHTRDPVYFSQAVERISGQLGPCIWLEAGSESGVSILRRALGKRVSSHNIMSVNLVSSQSLKQLAEITADLWRLGLGIEFWPFCQSQQHQYEALNLPPYQFDKARHWLEWQELGPPAIEIQNPAPGQTELLKLLRQTKDEAAFQISTECVAWQAICSEHHVLSIRICPLSSALSLISKAIDTIQDASTRKAGVYNMQHLKIERPISAEQKNGLALTIAIADQPRSWSFIITEALDPTHTYISGAISLSAGNEGYRKDFTHFQSLLATSHIKGLTNDPEADSVKGKAVYKSLAPLYQVPKHGQIVKEVSAKGDEATAYLTSPFESSFVATESFVQAALLCLNSLHDREDNEMYINTAVGSAQFDNSFNLPSDKGAPYAAYLKFTKQQGMEATCNIFAFDLQSEQLFATILDVNFTRVEIDTLRRALDHAVAPSQPVAKSYSGPLETLKRADSSDNKQTPHLELSFKEPVSSQPSSLPDLTQALYDLLCRVADVDVNELRSDVAIPDLGIDSLMAMEVAEEINKFFSISVSSAEFAAVDDVASLCRLVADRTTGFTYDTEISLKTQSDETDTAKSSVPSPTSGTPDTELSSNEQVSRDGSRSSSPTRSIQGSLSGVVQAFDTIRGDFDIIARAKGCDKFWSEVYPSQFSLITAYILEAFAKLGCDLRMVNTGETIRNVPQPPKNKKFVRQLMRALRDGGFVTEAGNEWVRTEKIISNQPSFSERYKQILSDFPQFAPEHELLHAVGSEIDECLSGKMDPLNLLFGNSAKRKLMADQYLIAPIQASVSQQLCKFIEQCFSSQANRKTVSVLEIGGGTCGTTLPAVKAFAKVGVPVEYTFSDISSSFVSAAKAKLSEHKFVSFRTLDVTESPSPDLRCHFDMIIATNVVHATPNVCESASNIRQMLRPGGFLTLIEYTRHLYMLDVIFGQLNGWWAHDDGRDHAIMDVDEWKTTLGRAGFEKVDWTEGRSEESQILRIILAS